MSKEDGRFREAGKVRRARLFIMSSAESKSREAKHKVYKRVHDGQTFARKSTNGQVDYAGRLDVANVCNYGLFLASKRGIPMPTAVRTRPFDEEGDDPNDMAYYAGFTGTREI